MLADTLSSQSADYCVDDRRGISTKGGAVDSSELVICEVVLVVGFAIVDIVDGTEGEGRSAKNVAVICWTIAGMSSVVSGHDPVFLTSVEAGEDKLTTGVG